MASSSRKLVVANLILILLISGMFWFMFNGGSFDTLNFGITSGTKPISSSDSTIPQGLSAQDSHEIEALKKQLEAEKKRAASARAQLQIRLQNTPPQKEAPINNSESNQTAPPKGTEVENKRLKQVLS